MKELKALSVLVLGGVLGMAGVTSVYAAENASGVAEHMDLTVKTTQAALDSAKAGNKDECLSNIKLAKQHYKEITGDAAGMPLQKAINRLKAAQAECADGKTADATTTLTEVVAALSKIQSGIK